MLKKVFYALLGLVITVVAILWYLANTFTDVPVDQGWQAQASTGDLHGDQVRVRFTGTSTLLFDDGDTRWMTDGWFTRIGWLSLLGKIQPNLAQIERGLAANGVDSLAAVLPFHSHFDHAMDAPEVARRTGALLIGSESTANIGRGWGLPESQIRVLQDRKAFRLGNFTITPVLTRHFAFPGVEMSLLEAPIDEPLVPPVAMPAYKEGGSWAFHVEHPKGSWLIIGSAGYVEGAFAGLQADTVFLGVGGLGGQTAEYRDKYWFESVTRVGAKRVIPIHWDSLTGSLYEPFSGQALFFQYLAARDFSLQGHKTLKTFLLSKVNNAPGVEIITLPRFDPVVLW